MYFQIMKGATSSRKFATLLHHLFWGSCLCIIWINSPNPKLSFILGAEYLVRYSYVLAYQNGAGACSERSCLGTTSNFLLDRPLKNHCNFILKCASVSRRNLHPQTWCFGDGLLGHIWAVSWATKSYCMLPSLQYDVNTQSAP